MKLAVIILTILLGLAVHAEPQSFRNAAPSGDSRPAASPFLRKRNAIEGRQAQLRKTEDDATEVRQAAEANRTASSQADPSKRLAVMSNGKPAKHKREMWQVQDHGLDSLHLHNGAPAKHEREMWQKKSAADDDSIHVGNDGSMREAMPGNARMNDDSSSSSEVEDDNVDDCESWKKWPDSEAGDDDDAENENKWKNHEQSRSYRSLDGDATPYPDGIIPYEFQDSFPQAHQATVLGYWNELLTQVNHAGMQGSIQRAKCVSIRPRTVADDYGIYVSRDQPDQCMTGGAGFEGNQLHRFTNSRGVDQGRHLMYLGLKPRLGVPNCLNRNIIHHEFMHVLGFDHEHQRPDRDLYIKVRKNLRNTDNYRIMDDMKNMGFDYDFMSVMHYSQIKHKVKVLGLTIRCERDMHMKNSILRILAEDDPRREKFHKFRGIRGANNLDIRKIRCFYGCNHKNDCPAEKPYPVAPVVDVKYDSSKDPWP